MTSFLDRLTADEKDLLVVWDFDDLGARFVTRNVGGFSPAGKSPLDLGAPAIWFRADDITGVPDNGNTGTVPLPEHSGNFVNGWIDGPATGTNGVVFHSATGAAPLNGHAWVEQPATRADLALTGTGAELATTYFDGDLTFAVVFRASPPDVHASWTLGRKLTGSNAIGIGGPNVSAAGAGFFYSETANDQAGTEDVNTQTWRILIVRRSGSSVDIFGTVDDGSVAKLFGSPITNAGRMIFDGIFSAKNGTESDPGMGMAEAIAYRGLSISDADRLELYNWLAARFGLAALADVSDVFDGAIADQDEGSELDLFSGELSVGGTGFEIPDLDGAVTAWIVANEASLKGAKITRREGFADVPIDEWAETVWTLEDYGGSGPGGGYKFRLENVLGEMGGALFEDFDTKVSKLDADLLATETVEFDLDKAPSIPWREPGYLLLWDTALKRGELASYSALTGATVSLIQRELYGVGDSFVGDFAAATTEVYHVWAKRDSPLELALRLLLTNPEKTGASTAVQIDQNFVDPSLDVVSWPLPTGYPGLGEWYKVITGSADVTEELSIVRGGSAARLTSSGSDKAILRQATGPITIAAGKFFALAFYHRDVDAGEPVEIQIASVLSTVDQEYFDGIGWTGTPTWLSIPAPDSGSFRRHELIFEAPALTAENLDFRWRNPATSGSVVVDSCMMRGWYDVEPATIWDDGSGDGLGLDASLIDIEAVELLRDQVLPTPKFFSSGDRDSGVATLFLELDPIDDVGKFLEKHLFRPFAVWPVTDDEERFFLRRYAETPAIQADVDDEWDKGKFKASSWKRELAKLANNLSLGSDFDPTEVEAGLIVNRQSDSSIAAYGKSKLRKLEGRGCRTGLFGFPDYQSQADLNTSAGLLFLEIGAPNGSIIVRAFYRWRGVSLGQAIRLNAPLPDLGAGTPTAIETLFTLLRRRIDNERGFVELQVRQPRSVLRAAFVAPNSVASTYSAASPADRTHCYIGPDSGEFSDGSSIYTVI